MFIIFSKDFLYVYCVAFLLGLNNNLFILYLFFFFGTRFDQEPQYNSIHFTQFALETCFDLRSILCSQFICLSPTHLSAHCLRCSCCCCCFARTVPAIIIQSHGSADCFCILFLLRALSVCVYLFVFFALLCSAQFDELLSSPFVKLRCTLWPSRLRARLHCTALRVSASRVYDYVSVCVCVSAV